MTSRLPTLEEIFSNGADLSDDTVLQELGDGFSARTKLSEVERNLSDAIELQSRTYVHNLERQKLATTNAMGRARALRQLGALSEEELAQIERDGTLTLKELERIEVTTKQKMAKLNDDVHDFITRGTKNMESIVKEGLNNDAQAARDAEKVAKKAADSMRSLVESDKIEVELWQRKAAEAATAEERARAEVQLSRAEEKLSGHENDLIGLEARERAATAATEKAEQAIANSTYRKSVDAIDSVLKKSLIDVKASWGRLKTLSSRMHRAGEIITKGNTIYYERFAQDAESASLYWKEALGVTESSSKAEIRVFEESVKRLSQITDREEFIREAARYATPSSRMMIISRAELAELREAEYASSFMKLVGTGEWVGYGLRAGARTAGAAAFKAVESVLGPEITEGLLVGVGAVAEAGISFLEWYFSPTVMVAIVAFEIYVDFLKYGMSWKFVDHALSHFWLSLQAIGEIKEKLTEYPEVSREIKGDSKLHPQSQLMKYDADELALVIDYWGKTYIDLQNSLGHKYPPYSTMKPFTGHVKVPGRYINLAHHPLETDFEIDDNKHIETMLETGAIGANLYSISQVDAWFPRKKGFVRNLRNFPVYDMTFQWPDPDQGIPTQTGGNFSETDLDPTIVAAFKLWAQKGTYGPVYNTSNSARGRWEAVQANKEDLQQWFNPSMSWHFAWNELDTWIRGLRGKRAIMYSDMLVLAPKVWLQEWETDIPYGTDSLWESTFSTQPWKNSVFMCKEKYEAAKTSVGRYTYHPADRTFLERVINEKKIYKLSVENPLAPDHKLIEPLRVAEFTVLGIYEFDATPAEVSKYTAIMNQGNQWKALLDQRAKETDDEWKQQVMAIIWRDYVRSEQPLRTLWGYIYKYRHIFIEELMYVCNYLAGTARSRLWAEYIKLAAGSKVPLHMNSVHRVAYMGAFASLAYSPSEAREAAFLADIKKRFGGVLENDLVTTAADWKKLAWTHGIKRVIVENKTADLPIIFGSLNARMFVLDKPRVVVIALKGTSDLWDVAIDLDFIQGQYVQLVPNLLNQRKVDIKNVPDDVTGDVGVLTGDERFMMVHNGFLRASSAIEPGITKMLETYMRKYNNGITNIFITGHSLGAAMAQIVAMMIPRLPVFSKSSTVGGPRIGLIGYRNPHVYAFSSPLVGDERFQRHFGQWSGESAQVWIDGDLITSIPPFLLPNRTQSGAAYKDALATIRAMSLRNPGIAGLMWVLKQGIRTLQIPFLSDFEKLYSDYKHFNGSKLKTFIYEVFQAANDLRPVRGGSAFVRFQGTESAVFYETDYDSGNSAGILQLIGTAPSFEAMRYRHSIDTLVPLLIKAAENSPDLFDLDVENLPSWSNGGAITPSGGKGGGKVPRSIAHMLMDGRAEIIGFAKTAHRYKPFTIVPKDDIVSESAIAFADASSVKEELIHGLSVKRRRTDKSDPSYRMHGYL